MIGRSLRLINDDVSDEGDANLRALVSVPRVEAPTDFPVLYAWAERDDVYRIRHREADAWNGAPTPDECYALSGSGWRLAGYGVRAHWMLRACSFVPIIR